MTDKIEPGDQVDWHGAPRRVLATTDTYLWLEPLDGGPPWSVGRARATKIQPFFEEGKTYGYGVLRFDCERVTKDSEGAVAVGFGYDRKFPGKKRYSIRRNFNCWEEV